MENGKSISISIIILTIGITLSSIWLGYSVQKLSTIQTQNYTMDSNVFTISQVAKYIRMTEEDVQGIINTEKLELETSGSFSGLMFPYFIVNGEQYFYKNKVDEWLEDASSEHREYDINNKILLN